MVFCFYLVFLALQQNFNIFITKNIKYIMLSESYKKRLLELSGVFTPTINEITSKEAFDKFYNNKEKYPALKGDENIFNQIVDAIPTNNNQFNKGYFEWIYRMIEKNQISLANLSDLKDYLTTFKEYFNVIPKDKRDINKFKSIDDLYQVIKDFKEKDLPKSKTQELKQIKEKEIKKVYDSGDWSIYVPLTERASCLIGKGTKWCTSAEEDNYFDNYNEKGKLYVIINKDENEKYQLHLEEKELRDSKNSSLDALHFFEYVSDGELIDFFEKEDKEKFYKFILLEGVELLGDGGYSELFFETLNDSVNVLDEEFMQKLLSSMRYSIYNDELIYYGFMMEKEPYNISKYELEGLEHMQEDDMLNNIINHLNSIGYDLKDRTGIDFVDFIKAKENLKKLSKQLKVNYKLNDKYIISINSIDSKNVEKPYNVTLFNLEDNSSKKANISIERLNNLFNQGLLFQ